jgi:hypothetical protein
MGPSTMKRAAIIERTVTNAEQCAHRSGRLAKVRAGIFVIISQLLMRAFARMSFRKEASRSLVWLHVLQSHKGGMQVGALDGIVDGVAVNSLRSRSLARDDGCTLKECRAVSTAQR